MINFYATKLKHDFDISKFLTRFNLVVPGGYIGKPAR